MSAWKLVEAVPEEAPVATHPRTEGEGNNNNGGRGGGRFGFRGGRGGRGRGNYPQLSKQDRTYLAYMAVQQIEWIFTSDNLCMDTYIRSCMDEAGYVPVSYVCAYPHVAAYGALYVDIVARLQEACATDRCVIEIDAENETIRLKKDWEVWLAPNAFGGRGQPRYVKQPRQPRTYNNNNHHSNNHHNNSGNHHSSPNKSSNNQPEMCFDPNAANQQQHWPTLAEQKTVQN